MFGEAPDVDGIQGIQHPPGSVPPHTLRAIVMAGIEALLDHRASLRASPGSPTSKLLRQ